MNISPNLEQLSIFNGLEDAIEGIISDISDKANLSMSRSQKAKFGAYFTPQALSQHMVNVAQYAGGKLTDAGAGSGILSALAVIRHAKLNNKNDAFLSVYEIQKQIHPYLKETMQSIEDYYLNTGINSQFQYELHFDYLKQAERILSKDFGNTESAIQNPPYFKLAKGDPLNQLFHKNLGYTVPNIYMAFVILAILDLKPGGKLTALIPRSFMNGRYFANARKHLNAIASIDSITRFQSRSNLFKGDNVLQENCIIHLSKVPQKSTIQLFTCETPESSPHSTMHVNSDIILNNGNSNIFILPANKEELDAFISVTSHHNSLSDLGCKASTGKVIVNRLEGANNQGDGATLIEGKSFCASSPRFLRKENSKLHNAIKHSEDLNCRLVAPEHRILIKRISSNSDQKRIHATMLSPEDSCLQPVALSNHVQYIEGRYAPLTEEKTHKLTEYLRSHLVELFIRAVSGTTQVNIDDLHLLRFPDL